MKYELHELETLATSTPFLEENDLFGYIRCEKVRSEVERIKRTFVKEVLSLENEKHIERYIQYHQQALIHLMDEIEYIIKPGFTLITISSDKIHYKALEELLEFIERHFIKYFDQDAKAPISYTSHARKNALVMGQKLQSDLIRREVDPQIIELLLAGIETAQITYRQVTYGKELQRQITYLLQQSNITNINEELRQMIYYLNYNSIKSFTYYTRHITSMIADADTQSEKIEKLSYLLKTINQAQVKPGMRFSNEVPSLKDHLSTFILEEIEYLEKNQRMNLTLASKQNDLTPEGFKIKFETSVAQLACLLKILLDLKYLQSNNLTTIMKFLCRFAVTKKTEVISFDSLRTKYYNIEQGTRQSVRIMLLNMVRHLEKDETI